MYYLKNGLKSYLHINLQNRKLVQEYGEYFIKFVDSLELNKEYDKKELFQHFCEENFGIITFEQRTFTTMIRDYAK
jgi:hypothetical protein